MRVIRWVSGALLGFLAVSFAVANSAPVPVTWSPFHPDMTMPLSLVCLAALVIGFVAGSFIVWIDHFPIRRERRKQQKTIRKLERELESESALAGSSGGESTAPPYQLEGPRTLQ